MHSRWPRLQRAPQPSRRPRCRTRRHQRRPIASQQTICQRIPRRPSLTQNVATPPTRHHLRHLPRPRCHRVAIDQSLYLDHQRSLTTIQRPPRIPRHRRMLRHPPRRRSQRLDRSNAIRQRPRHHRRNHVKPKDLLLLELHATQHIPAETISMHHHRPH